MEETDINEYGYLSNQKVELDGQTFTNLMSYLNQVIVDQTEIGYSNSYVKKSKEKFETQSNGEKVLQEVEQEFVVYPNPNSYFSQQPQTFTSMIGAGASDLLLVLQSMHVDNIKKGVAKKVGAFKTVQGEA